jgi:eukaryotic-like serine/threonine-protein kinase
MRRRRGSAGAGEEAPSRPAGASSGGGRKGSAGNGASGGGRGRRRGPGSVPGLPGDRFLRLLGLAFLMILVGGGSGYLFATRVLFPVPEETGELVEVPDLRGMGATQAREALESGGLVVGAVDSIRHPSAEEGRVLGQSPLAGQQALPGAEVHLTVSQGVERRPLPDVMGIQSERAVSLLEATGFTVVVDTVDSEEARGVVVAQEPGAGTPVMLAGTIRLEMSLGPPSVEVPDLMGLPEEEALERIRGSGLEVGEVRTTFRFGRDRGLVVEQDPAPGLQVDRGSPVTLVVGRR